MYFDWTYMVLLMPCLIFATWASTNVGYTFRKYAHQYSAYRITGREAAQRVLNANGLYHVQIEHVSGTLTDHYDPTSNTIRLSDTVYDATSTAAIGVACHEAGHAIQYAHRYFPIQLRSAIVPITSIGSRVAVPMIFAGVFLSFLSTAFYQLVYLGIACFGLSFVFQLITLPVEFDASRRAMRAISQGGFLTDDEMKGARKTLRAAALTYVAAMATSLAQFLRLILIYGRGGRRRN